MILTLDPILEAALNKYAVQQGVAPESLVLNALREKFIGPASILEPQDEWERVVLGAGTNCGVSLSQAAFSSEGLYE